MAKSMSAQLSKHMVNRVPFSVVRGQPRHLTGSSPDVQLKEFFSCIFLKKKKKN